MKIKGFKKAVKKAVRQSNKTQSELIKNYDIFYRQLPPFLKVDSPEYDYEKDCIYRSGYVKGLTEAWNTSKKVYKSPKWYNRIPIIRTWVKWFTKN